MAKVDVQCPFCEQAGPVKKHGLGNAGHQRYRCQSRCRTFQLDYAYRACQPGMKEQITDLATNNAGKLYTQRIERENLSLRNRLKRLNRKTLGYSKSAEMHDRIIAIFIEREYYLQ